MNYGDVDGIAFLAQALRAVIFNIYRITGEYYEGF